MTNFEWCQYAYKKGWATAVTLKSWVSAKKITADEFKEITSQDYIA
jgi:hypothetical protein